MLTAVVNHKNEALLMWRHRFAVDEWGWELPGGIAEPGEESAATAAREFEEETGWRPTGPMRHLISFQPMPGMVDMPHEVWTADAAEKVGEPSDAEEAAIIEWVPLANVPEMVKRGEIAGSGPLVGLLTLLMERQSWAEADSGRASSRRRWRTDPARRARVRPAAACFRA